MLYVDVGVANLSASDTEPVEGERVNLTVNVTNAGNLNATGVEAAFYADGFQFDSKLLSVPANGTNTTASSWVAAPGRHRLSVVLDPGNELGDTDRSNNTADITVTVNDRPRAVLSATPLTVLTNESVLLNGSLSYDSSGIGRYLFDFGDGNGTGWTSSPTASHAYLENGAYQATLRVEDAQSAVSDAASVILTVLDRGPTAFPYSNVSRAMTFEAIRFASNATDSDGTITAYAWDFGDGSGSSEAEPVHNYSTSGAYTIGLMVTDNDGKTADASLHMIIDDRAPLVSIEVSDSRGTIETGFLLKANASDPDGTVAAWEWDLGDGATSNSKSVSHTFGRPGNYTVRLTVRDDSGSESRSTTTIHVIDTPPKAAAFVSTVETDTFKRVQFTGDESSDLEGPITFSWDFGDGNTSSEPSPYHAYARPGYYNSTLTVRDSAGQNDTVALPAIDVANRRPTAQFRFFGCFTQNGTVIFDGSGSSDPEGPVSWSWDFGDGRSAAGAVAEHIFPAAGNYTINLTVTDLDGGTNSATAVVSVLAPPSPPSVKRKPAPEDKTSTVNILLVVVVLLIVLLAVVALWGASRVRKPGLENTPMQGPVPPDGPPPGPSMQTAFKEFSPSEEQLKGAPRH
jgi:PKD repeat protein